MATVYIGSARIDERGKATGGKAGDQTGKEVSTQSWYLHSKGWIVLRAKDPAARERIARCMECACASEHIGYDQGGRITLYNAVKDIGFDVLKLTKDVETDCSALVRVCCAFAGISAGNFTTSNQVAVLMATGAFDKYTDDLHCKKSANLLRGDILVTRTKGHTVIVLTSGANARAEGDTTLRKGSAGDAVRQLQQVLMRMGYDVGASGVDGDFGNDTEAAVRAFQADHGIDQTGVYDAATQSAVEAQAKTVTVTVKKPSFILSGNGDQYESIGIASVSASYAYVATAANGWIAIDLGDCVGWIRADACEEKGGM